MHLAQHSGENTCAQRKEPFLRYNRVFYCLSQVIKLNEHSSLLSHHEKCKTLHPQISLLHGDRNDVV